MSKFNVNDIAFKTGSEEEVLNALNDVRLGTASVFAAAQALDEKIDEAKSDSLPSTTTAELSGEVCTGLKDLRASLYRLEDEYAQIAGLDPLPR